MFFSYSIQLPKSKYAPNTSPSLSRIRRLSFRNTPFSTPLGRGNTDGQSGACFLLKILLP